MSEVNLDEFVSKMKKTGCGDAVVSLFLRYYDKLKSGDRGIMHESDIKPLEYGEVLRHRDMEKSKIPLQKCAVIKLNGGLGTSMGMDFPKSFVEVREGKRFIDLALSQKIFFEKNTGNKYPLIFMNSLSTKDMTQKFVDENPQILFEDIDNCFTQHSFVKVLKDTLEAAQFEKDRSLEYNPAGHGDVYMAMYESGILDKLLKKGFRFAFISNIDNSAATLDASIVNFMTKNDIPFLMEVCRRTDMDKKGGHLAKNKSGGYVLRERAQTDAGEIPQFEDINRYSYFNTNSVWVDLLKLKEIIDKTSTIELPFIANEKTLDPNDKTTAKVYQIEQAMGAAIGMFDDAKLLEVEKDRFFPVKTTNDLFLLRSDRYFLQDSEIKSFDDNKSQCTVELENKYYANLSDFEERVKNGVPSLRLCRKLSVRNDILFDRSMKLDGEVVL